MSKVGRPKQDRSKAPEVGGYSKRERAIFWFWDGTREKGIDPLDVQMALDTMPGFDLEADCKLCEIQAVEAQGEAKAALRRIIAAVRGAFGVKEFATGEDGAESGLTGGECLALLLEFTRWVEELKKSERFADFAECYGIGGFGRRLTYAEFVALYLHRGRVLERRALAVSHGIAEALGGKSSSPLDLATSFTNGSDHGR